MCVRLVQRSMTLNCYYGRILNAGFRRFERQQLTGTTKGMKIDPQCQRQRCNPLNVGYIRSSFRRFAVDFFATGSYTHCCRALTLALARLSCK